MFTQTPEHTVLYIGTAIAPLRELRVSVRDPLTLVFLFARRFRGCMAEYRIYSSTDVISAPIPVINSRKLGNVTDTDSAVLIDVSP